MLGSVKSAPGLFDTLSKSSQDYTLLDGDSVAPRPRPAPRRWLPLTVAFILGALAAAAVSVLLVRGASAAAAPTRRFPYVQPGFDAETGLPLHWYNGDCGNSAAEARARDCHFDSAIHAWLPQDCVTDADREDEALMYSGRAWPFVRDGRNMTLAEVQAGDYHNMSTSFDMHMTHCMYVLKRMHRVMLDPSQKMDSYTVNFNHTTHCVDLLQHGAALHGHGGLSHKLFVKYPVCL